MKSLIILATVIFIISCKQHNVSDAKTNNNQKIVPRMKNDYLRVSDTPISKFCLKIDTLANSNYYQIDLDTFLIYHHFVKNSSQLINKSFHRLTKDFIEKNESYFMHYPYNGKAYSIKKVNINKDITAVFYAYLFDSEIIQPRIEIQTFNNKQENIDNLIVASTFTSECSGYREFCINGNIVNIFDYYYCNESNLEHESVYRFKINDKGLFLKQKL